jgi:multiple sugar transport system permease protein
MTVQHGVDQSLGTAIDAQGRAASRQRAARGARGPGRLFVVAALGVLTVIFMAPFAWLISASLKTRTEVFNREWIPDPIAPQNYLNVWQEVPLLNWMLNSGLVSVMAALTVTLSSALVAFAFAYFRFRGRNLLFGVVLATMMLPGIVMAVPRFIIWDQLGLVNTLFPLWAGNLFGSAFYIFLLRQFFLSLPRELFEAARVDGANYLRMWWSVAVPLTRPALIVVAIFELRASWTDLYNGLIYLQNAATFTLPRGLKAVLDQFGRGGEMQWEIVLAASVIITIPMIVVFFLGQRYFVEGIATTGSKG